MKTRSIDELMDVISDLTYNLHLIDSQFKKTISGQNPLFRMLFCQLFVDKTTELKPFYSSNEYLEKRNLIQINYLNSIKEILDMELTIAKTELKKLL